MTTLFDLTYGVAKALNIVSEGFATGGSTTTLIDTNMLTQDDDYWLGGTIWILYDAGGASAAPEGSFAVVSDFTASTDTATVHTSPMLTFSAAPASGDKYAIAKKRYPLDRMIAFINAALAEYGHVPYEDTSLTTASNQTEYNLPSALFNREVRAVYVQTNSDSDDNQWQQIRDWQYLHPGAPGTAGKLLLPQFDAGCTIKVVYMRQHPTLRIAADTLSDLLDPDVIIYAAALKCLMWYKAKTDEAGVPFNEQVNFVQAQLDRLRASHRTQMVPRMGKMMVVGE